MPHISFADIVRVTSPCYVYTATKFDRWGRVGGLHFLSLSGNGEDKGL